MLVDDVRSELLMFRREAEALMVDTIFFSEPGTEDWVDGAYVTTPGATLYDGPCQVQVTDVIPRDATVGEQELVIERVIVKIPWGAADVPPNSVGEITAVGEGSGSVVGARYRVTGSHAKTYATARRLPCDLVTPS